MSLPANSDRTKHLAIVCSDCAATVLPALVSASQQDADTEEPLPNCLQTVQLSAVCCGDPMWLPTPWQNKSGMVRARTELPSVVVTEPGGHQTLILSPSHTSIGTPGSLSRAEDISHLSGRSRMTLATAGSVLHPSYLGLPRAGPRPAFSGGCRGALLLTLSSATACALLGPPSTTLNLNMKPSSFPPQNVHCVK